MEPKYKTALRPGILDAALGVFGWTPVFNIDPVDRHAPMVCLFLSGLRNACRIAAVSAGFYPQVAQIPE
jgi:hypothetical protein